jgi:hypothetical protein
VALDGATDKPIWRKFGLKYGLDSPFDKTAPEAGKYPCPTSV